MAVVSLPASLWTSAFPLLTEGESRFTNFSQCDSQDLEETFARATSRPPFESQAKKSFLPFLSRPYWSYFSIATSAIFPYHQFRQTSWILREAYLNDFPHWISQIDSFVNRSVLAHDRDKYICTFINLGLEMLKWGERVFFCDSGFEGFMLDGIGGWEHVLHVLPLVLHCEEIIDFRLYH